MFELIRAYRNVRKLERIILELSKIADIMDDETVKNDFRSSSEYGMMAIKRFKRHISIKNAKRFNTEYKILEGLK